VEGAAGVLEVQTFGDLLRIVVDDAERRAPELAAALTAEGVEVLSMRRTRPRMQEAFISLVSGHDAARARGRSTPDATPAAVASGARDAHDGEAPR
jgi:hypothetical protein